MPPKAESQSFLVLVHGDDEFAVKQQAKQIFNQWAESMGSPDQDVVEGQAGNAGEAVKILGRARQALQTLPFFGSGKIVWLRQCNFLGEERTAASQLVTEALADWLEELKRFKWDNTRLLISAGKVDKRKAFYKAIEKLGRVEAFIAWSADDKDWVAEAETLAETQLRDRGKKIDDQALLELVSSVGPNRRQLINELEKLSLYVGDRPQIGLEDTQAIVTRNKQAKAFALGDALGERNLPKLLRTLDEELWEMKLDNQRSEIGILYGLITKVRAMLFLKEMLRERWIQAGADFNAFRAQLQRVPAEQLPEDKRFNPLSFNPYVLFKALPHARMYTTEELVRAMEILLEANQRLISTALDETLVLQQALVRIAQGNQERIQLARRPSAR